MLGDVERGNGEDVVVEEAEVFTPPIQYVIVEQIIAGYAMRVAAAAQISYGLCLKKLLSWQPDVACSVTAAHCGYLPRLVLAGGVVEHGVAVGVAEELAQRAYLVVHHLGIVERHHGKVAEVTLGPRLHRARGRAVVVVVPRLVVEPRQFALVPDARDGLAEKLFWGHVCYAKDALLK